MMGWLEKYLDYTEQFESPVLFHLWSAVAVLGHILGRRVWVEQQAFRLYPGQIMVVLVSESAVTRKSTAAQLAIDFMRYLPPERVNRLPNKMSPTTLMEALQRLGPDGAPVPAVGFIYARELGTFFSKESFAETMATHITDLNDAPDEWVYETKNTGRIVLPEPCVGMLGCTTPVGLAHELPKAAQGAGFFGRLLMIYQDQPKRANDLLDPMPEQAELREWLVRDLIRISRLEGPVTFEPDAKAYYREWYQEHIFTSGKYSATAMAETGYLGRKHSHLLRVATVMLAAKRSALVMDRHTLESARRLLDQIESLMGRAHSQLDTSDIAKQQEQVINAVERYGEQTYRELYKRLWQKIDPERFRLSIKALLQVGIIEDVSQAGEEQRFRLNLPKGRMLQRVREGEDDEDEARTA